MKTARDWPLPPDAHRHCLDHLMADPEGGWLAVSWCPCDDDDAWLAMALDEALIWSWVQHPNVLVYLGSRFANDGVYVYQRHVLSWSLRRLMREAARRREAVPIPIAAALVLDVLAGVRALHTIRSPRGDALGLVHRCLDVDHVVVGHDGVARVRTPLPGRGIASGRYPVRGQLVRFRVCAPEQVEGLAVDARTDIHACARLLWELLTGERAFLADSDLDSLLRVRAGDIAPPSSLRPEVSPALDALVMRGLARKPADRFESAEAMAVALRSTVPAASAGEVAAWAEAMLGPTPESCQQAGSGDFVVFGAPPGEQDEEIPAGGSPYRTAPQRPRVEQTPAPESSGLLVWGGLCALVIGWAVVVILKGP